MALFVWLVGQKGGCGWNYIDEARAAFSVPTLSAALRETICCRLFFCLQGQRKPKNIWRNADKTFCNVALTLTI